MKIDIVKLPAPLYEGDWHDKPLKWQVVGPGAEIQNFATKSNANRYRKIRRRSPDFVSAVRAY